MSSRIRVFAPATVANLGPGFDVLGLALEEPGDLVEAELTNGPRVEIVEITGDGGQLSTDPDRNVVGRAAAEVLRRVHVMGQVTGEHAGIRLWLHKQMPLASGLGSSGASSAAGAWAAHELLGARLDRLDLLRCAMEGERAATGAAHADNVAPSLFGGIVLVRSYDPLEIVPLPVPASLWIGVAHPHYELSTSTARAVLSGRQYPIADVVRNLGNLGGLVAALHSGDLALLGRSIADALVEPLRAPLVPGFREVKTAALSAGGLGCSIAGAGPSMFVLCASEASARQAGAAMCDAFHTAARVDADLFVGRVGRTGARVISERPWALGPRP